MTRTHMSQPALLISLIACIAALGCSSDSPTVPTPMPTPAPTPEPTPTPVAFECPPVVEDLSPSCPNPGTQGPVFDLLVEVQQAYHQTDEGREQLTSAGKVKSELAYRNGLANFFDQTVPQTWCTHRPANLPDEIWFKEPNVLPIAGSESWSMDVVTGDGFPWVGTSARCRPSIFDRD